ncbi:hypothetical protein [Rufibacter sp. XAAS-G3-1]|uniref:hypothetical protein n=1 Tax=Rufibacter sp. XAAS-G3-1 TaxID=2729134 RepID=UPI0015E65AEE|nr:hypothetical protein [Rufibacter sp. XAAS-G3-1]
MEKKLYAFVVCCFLCFNAFSQRTEKDAFVTPDKKNIGYDIFSFTDFSIHTFIIIIPSDQTERNYLIDLLKRQKGLEKYRVQFYIPDASIGAESSEKQKQEFVGLVDYITGRKKLIDSNFFIVAPINKSFLSEHYLSLTDSGKYENNKLHRPKGTVTLEKNIKITDKYLLELLEKDRNTYP